MASSVINIPKKLPLLVIGNDVLLPGLSMRIPVSTPKNMSMVRQHLMKSSLTSAIIGVMSKNLDIGSNEITQESDLHSIGSAAVVVQITGTNYPHQSYSLLVTGLCRFKLVKLLQHYPYPVGLVEQLDKLPVSDDIQAEETNEELAAVIDKFKLKAFALLDILDISQPISHRLKRILNSVPTHSLADFCASIVKASYSEKLDILDAVNLSDRFEKMLPLLQRQIDTLQVLPKPKRNQLDKALPFKQMTKRSILDDANDDGDLEVDDIVDLENKLNLAKMPPYAHKIAMKELQRLKKMMPQLPEYSLTRAYLELMVELPWSKTSKQILDINKARKDLESDHYAMEKVKKRVLEYLAVCQLKNSLKGPILCFVGPPGVGKTSIGRSIANTLRREFHRISLGGVCDQSDIRGHRRTYIGALPGRIIQGLRLVGVNNPVFLLDEIDKLSSGLHGNPSAALLEVLDPEQNSTFTDHYLNVPFDLSQVLFIATANTTSTIPPALLDRMEIIPVAGYMQEEKIHIALQHLIPKQIKENGLSEKILTIPDESVKLLASRYTREAGVRSLERKIGALCRAVAVKVAEGNQERESAENVDCKKSKDIETLHPPELPIVLDEIAIEDILGPPVYENEIGGRLGQPGVAIGLAWTPLGGKIMFIEATTVHGDGDLILTGQLGDVMKESAKIALNWVRSRADMVAMMTSCNDVMKNKDVHIHFPSGAVEKDGPSAGITIATVLVSLFTGRCVRSDLAMTGEVTLRGLILPVGGVKEKVLAAHRAGITTVLLPYQNLKDLHDIPENIQSELTFVFVKTIEEALQNAFEGGFNLTESQIENVIPSNL